MSEGFAPFLSAGKKKMLISSCGSIMALYQPLAHRFKHQQKKRLARIAALSVKKSGICIWYMPTNAIHRIYLEML